MKLTVVGFWGGYPAKNGASTGYLLEHDGFKLLVDCGSGVLSKLQHIVQPEELDAVILSHYHPDHVADIGVLYHARLIQGFIGGKLPELPIYAHNKDEDEFRKLTHNGITRGVAYQPGSPLEVGPFTITFEQTEHPVPCYAMRFDAGGKTLFYTADTSYKEEFEQFGKGADVLLSECNFYSDQSGKGAGHMNSTDCGILARKINTGHLILTHLPHFGDHQKLLTEAQKEFSGKVSLAKEFLSITL